MMKKWAIILSALLTLNGWGQTVISDNTEAAAFYNLQSTNSVVLGTNATPVTVLTVNAMPVLYSTFHIMATNSAAYCIDDTIDGQNWLMGATNALTANTLVEVTFTKEVSQFRVRLQGTNQTVVVNYEGGR